VHALMDAVTHASVRAGDVDEITCAIPGPAVGIVCEPRAERLHPATTYAAQFSLPFAVASALVGGREGLDLFGEEARADKRILSLAERVRHVVDDSIPTFGGRVTIALRDGRVREAEELINRGHPDRPLSDEDVTAKFLANARRRLDNGAAQKVADTVWRLDEIDSISELASLVQVP
jgi:2-methylcitrate dehydratase PrpD